MTAETREAIERKLDKYRAAVAAGWKGGPLPGDPDAFTTEQVIGGRA